jgi:hypothetical protein
MRAARTAPIFRIFDVDKAKAFHVGYLGLAVDWEHKFAPAAPVYMQAPAARSPAAG